MLRSGLRSAASASQSLRDGAAGISQALSTLAGAEGVPEEVRAQIAAVQRQADTFSASVSAYTYGVDEAADGSAQIASEIPDLQNGISAVQGGADSLKNGIGQLLSLIHILEHEESYGVRIEHRDIGKDSITKRK